MENDRLSLKENLIENQKVDEEDEAIDSYIKDIEIIKHRNKKNDIKSIIKDLLIMGFDKNIIQKCFVYNEIPNIEQAITLLTKENNIWQHKFVKQRKDITCVICNENSDHIDYKVNDKSKKLHKIIPILNSKINRYSVPNKLSRNEIPETNINYIGKSEEVYKNDPNNINKIDQEISEDKLREKLNASLYSIDFSKNEGEDENIFYNIYLGEKDQDIIDIFGSSNKINNEEICFKKVVYMTCSICYLESKEFFKLNCNHSFCENCWESYLEEKIKTSNVEKITCMMANCPEEMSREDIEFLCKYESFVKYLKFKENINITKSNTKKFCPILDCGSYAEVHPTDPNSKENIDANKFVTCLNGHSFCYNCLSNWHGKVKCQKVVSILTI